MLEALPVVRGNAKHLGASAACSAGAAARTALRGRRQVRAGGGRCPAGVHPSEGAGSPQRLGRLLLGRPGPGLRERGRPRSARGSEAAGPLPVGAPSSGGRGSGRVCRRAHGAAPRRAGTEPGAAAPRGSAKRAAGLRWRAAIAARRPGPRCPAGRAAPEAGWAHPPRVLLHGPLRGLGI